MSLRTFVRWFAVLVALAAADGALAVQRTFVASYGLAANVAFNCSLAKPCRAFSEAIGVTSTDGEIVVLDSAGYGPVSITQSVSIIAPAGIYAGVTVASGDGITINAPGAVVRLKGLSINGQGGNDGIAFQQGTRLALERCSVSAMAANGINVTADSAYTEIADVDASGNGTNGIRIGGSTRASIVRARAYGNALSGFLIADGATVALRDSEAAKNIAAGLRGETNFGATTTVSIDGFSATAGQSGIDVAAPAPGSTTIIDVTRANLSGNTIAGVEIYGPSAFGSAIVTLTDSQVAGNGLRGVFISAPPSPKWSFTMGGNKIVNHPGAGLLNTGDLALVQSRGDNAISGNTPNVSSTLTLLGGL